MKVWYSGYKRKNKTQTPYLSKLTQKVADFLLKQITRVKKSLYNFKFFTMRVNAVKSAEYL